MRDTYNEIVESASQRLEVLHIFVYLKFKRLIN
jgi:hypothetical protein